MITNKSELAEYLEQDRISLGKKRKPNLMGDYVYKFEIVLRKCEYYKNTGRNNLASKIYELLYKYLSVKLGFTIPLNVFDKGLSIAHYGHIVVHPNARIGKNCRIHEGVTIGTTNGSSDAAKIGDNCFLASGAKVIGNVTIADNVAIGANAVVVKNIDEPSTTWGGVPAKKISGNSSRSNLNKALF